MNTDFEFSHLRVAREQLGLTQKEAANASGISQRDISQLESGLKKFFPLEYILFLNINNVNLNILFSNNLNIQNLIQDRLGSIRSIDPVSIQFDYSIFKKAREKAGFTQKQASDRSGLSQRDISQLEAGLKKFIPFQFISYLILIKADLNEIFKYSTNIASTPVSSTINDQSLPKKPDFPVKNKAPENSLFDSTPAIGKEYSTHKASENSPESTIEISESKVQPVNILTTENIQVKEPEITPEIPVKAATVKSSIADTPPAIKKSKTANGIAVVNKHVVKGYIQQLDKRDFIGSLPELSIPGLEAGDFRAFEITGREMEPLFFEGDLVIGVKLDDFNEIKNNHLYIIVNDKRIIIRRIINCIKASAELILLTDNETVANEVQKIAAVKEVWEFNLKITASVDQLKNSFNELYFQLLKIQKDLDIIKSKL
ncbi:helix-turn-helix transcriptional regulator [Solitalea canadensis]|uniref:Putative transcriptional regulator n=1 Tax=Solitalea canadensis (strain ATCC 29591 / DSM 3403 / JCM 21819 / LMG 8368 / NBRC 15130 / NCIMB 12057 / USAM 9D) TaxID=929556 RepID=H8KUF0_SOLCM|nr:helix-turn-helix transcriptional regulator [Solitalea canadensis]AFD07315.1 putative transcriptional regulator [Solitalea canadensis DSM 3403]